MRREPEPSLAHEDRYQARLVLSYSLDNALKPGTHGLVNRRWSESLSPLATAASTIVAATTRCEACSSEPASYRRTRLRLVDGLSSGEIDHYLIRDSQRTIEAIEALVRIHNAQEEDIYQHAAGYY